MSTRQTTNQIIRSASTSDPTKTTKQLIRDYFSNPPSGGGTNVNKRRMITFTFDDGHVSNYTRAYPILSENGFRATEFVNGATADVDSTRMTSAQIKELAHAGWEMACHTFTHPNLTTLTDIEIRDEIKNNKTFLEELTGRQVFTHAIPFGQHDARVRHMLNGSYEAIRKTQARAMSYGEYENLDQCPGWFWDTLDVSTIKGIIDNFMNDPEPKWLIPSFHGITAEPHADLLSEAEFREIVEYIRNTYAQNNLVDIVPFYEGARRILT